MADSGTLSIRLALEGGDQVRQQLQDIGTAGDQSLKKIGDGAEQASSKLDKAFSRLAGQLDPGIKAQDQFAKGSATLNAALGAGLTTQNEHARLMQLLASRATEGAAAFEISRREVISFARALSTGNFNEGATALARMGLGAAGAAGGTLLLVGAVGLLAGVFVAAVARLEEADQAAAKFEATIRGLGGSFGATGAEAQKFAVELAKTGPFSEADTQKAAAAVLQFRGVSVAAFKDILPLAEDLAAVTGEALPAAARQLAQAYTGDFAAIQKIDQELGLLRPKQLEQIRLLEEQGHTAAAAQIFFDALSGRIKGLADTIDTPLARSLKDLGNAWRDFLDSIASSGALETTATVLERIASTIDWLSTHRFGHLLAGESLIEPLDPMHPAPGGSSPNGPLDVSLRNKPTGLIGGAGAGGSSTADDDAKRKSIEDFDKSLDDQNRTLQATARGLDLYLRGTGDLGAAQLQAKLESEAAAKGILEEERSHIAAAVAIRRHVDVLEDLRQVHDEIYKQSLANVGLQRIADAGGSPAAEEAARRLNEAYAANQKSRDNAGTNQADLAEIDRQTAALEKQLTVRDQINLTIQANDEDRRLQQTLEEKQLQLQLLSGEYKQRGENAVLASQELADLKLRNELIEENYELGTKDFDDEYAKRKLIDDQIAATNVRIKEQVEAQKQASEAMKQFADSVGSALEKYATGTGTAHKRLQELEQDLAKIAEQQLIFKPFEANFQSLFTGQPAQGQGALAGVVGRAIGSPSGGGLLGWLFGSSTSSDVAAAVSSDAAHGWGGSGSASGGGGLLGAFFGDVSNFVSSIFGGGSGSSGSKTIANATLNIANATINGAGGAGSATSALSSGGGLGGIGDWFSNLLGGGSDGADFLASASVDPASFFGFAGLGFAKGGAFDRGITKFAAGGVVTDPTLFNIGQMGEAGPEAIMPLQRIGGQLGVRSLGGGGHTFNIAVDASGSTDPAAVRRMVREGIMEAAPHIVRAASTTAVNSTFGIVRQGGRGAQITGKR